MSMDTFTHAISQIEKQLPEILRFYDEPMKNHTSFRIGGPVRALYCPRTPSELKTLLLLLESFGIEPLVIGNGTNLLVDDCAHDLIVIKTTELSEILLVEDTSVSALCGAKLSKIALFARDNGLSGFEFAHGIPGTVGGAVLMNAGAYGSEMKDVVRETICLSAHGEAIPVRGIDHEFSYRHSRFVQSGEIILKTVLQLSRRGTCEISAVMEELSQRRRSSQPLDAKSAGSTFKRPQHGYAATLIEQAGLKGYTIGGAKVSEKHAGFVINCGDAVFSDVMRLIEHIKTEVYKRNNITLELEVKVIRG